MNKLIKIIENLEGSLILIGNFDIKVFETIKNNNKFSKIDHLNNLENLKKSLSKEKARELNIKKFKKFFKKKNTDNIICEFKDIYQYLNYFISISIYLTKESIYYLYENSDQKDLLISRYKRYKVTIDNENNILKIDVRNAKNIFFLDKIYFIIDNFSTFLDKISHFLLK